MKATFYAVVFLVLVGAAAVVRLQYDWGWEDFLWEFRR